MRVGQNDKGSYLSQDKVFFIVLVRPQNVSCLGAGSYAACGLAERVVHRLKARRSWRFLTVARSVRYRDRRDASVWPQVSRGRGNSPK